MTNFIRRGRRRRAKVLKPAERAIFLEKVKRMADCVFAKYGYSKTLPIVLANKKQG